MRGPVVALVLAALTTSGCVNGFICSRNGGARWRELTTEHFVLQTDYGPESARAYALQLEQLRDAVAYGLLESPPKGGSRVHVFLPKWPGQFDLFSRSGEVAFFTISRWGAPTIVVRAEIGSIEQQAIAHEITHMLTAVDLARQPPWFSEGLATYAETVRFVGPDRKVMMGDVVPRWRRLLSMPPIRGNMRAVLAEEGRLDAGGYLLAWALVHFLVTEQPDRLGALEDRYARGEDPAAAWRAVFPEWDPDAPGGVERLEDALARYASRPTTAFVEPHTMLPSIPPPSERLLSSAEVHDARLALPWPNRGRGVPHDRVLAEAREAVAEDPGSPTAVALLAMEPGADARALAERATRARPQDARTWAILADTFPRDDAAGREAALRRAVATDAESAVPLLALVDFLVEQHRAREAVPLARRCVQLAPWSPFALDGAAAVLEAIGDCRGALALSERATGVLSEGARAEVRKALSGRRDRLRAACGDSGPRDRPPGAS